MLPKKFKHCICFKCIIYLWKTQILTTYNKWLVKRVGEKNMIEKSASLLKYIHHSYHGLFGLLFVWILHKKSILDKITSILIYSSWNNWWMHIFTRHSSILVFDLFISFHLIYIWQSIHFSISNIWCIALNCCFFSTMLLPLLPVILNYGVANGNLLLLQS